MATQRAVGAWAWLIASLPHGNAYGHRSRKASTPTHQQPTATGHPGRRSISRCPIANRPKITASAIASAAHAYQATLISQDSSGTKNARPNASPTRKEPRRLRRQSAITSSAGATTANGQIPVGGNAASSASPPTIAMTSASRMGTPRRRPAVASAARPRPVLRRLPAALGCPRPGWMWPRAAPGRHLTPSRPWPAQPTQPPARRLRHQRRLACLAGLRHGTSHQASWVRQSESSRTCGGLRPPHSPQNRHPHPHCERGLWGRGVSSAARSTVRGFGVPSVARRGERFAKCNFPDSMGLQLSFVITSSPSVDHG